MLTTRPTIRPTLQAFRKKSIDQIPLEIKELPTTASLLESTSRQLVLTYDDSQSIVRYKSLLFALGATLINTGKAYAAPDFRFRNLDTAMEQVEKRSREQHEFIASDVASELVSSYNVIPRKNVSNKMYSVREFEHTRYHFLFVCRVALDHLEPLFVFRMFEKTLKTMADVEFANVLGLYIQFNLDKYKQIMTSEQIKDLSQTMLQLELKKDDSDVIKLLDAKLLDQWQVKWKQSKLAIQFRHRMLAVEEEIAVSTPAPADIKPSVDVDAVERRGKQSLSIDTDLATTTVINIPVEQPALPAAPDKTVSDKKEIDHTKALYENLVAVAKTTQVKYKKKYEDTMKNRYFFTQMIDAGREGQLRAEQFVKQLEQSDDRIETLLTIYKKHFDRLEYHWLGSHPGNLYDHSFDSMLLQAMAENTLVAGYFNLKSEQLQDMASRTKSRTNVVQFIDGVIKAKSDTPFAQLLR